MKDQSVIQALEEISRRKKGRLLAQDVVAAATNPESPLHDYFEWDDSAAAQKYRLAQARQLIVSVQIVSEGSPPTQLYYSLKNDRHHDGGYRDIRDLVKDEGTRQELMETAAWELTAFKERFQRIKRDLEDVFNAIDSLQTRVVERKKKSA